MAEELGVARRTVEPLRDVIDEDFDLEVHQEDRSKRFRITGSLRRVYTRPTAAEVAALQAEVDARARPGAGSDPDRPLPGVRLPRRWGRGAELAPRRGVRTGARAGHLPDRQMPTHDKPPVPFRVDRMKDVRASNMQGCPPDDWNLDGWIGQSFGIWREEDHDVVLRVRPAGAARARSWRCTRRR